MRYQIVRKEFVESLKETQKKRFRDLKIMSWNKGLSIIVGKGNTQVPTGIAGMAGPNGNTMTTKPIYILSICIGHKTIAQRQELTDDSIEIVNFLADFIGDYDVTTEGFGAK